MSLITQACLIPELASKATGLDATPGTLVFGKDGLWHAVPSAGVAATPITFQDEGGVVITGPSTINFAGSGITATASGTTLNINVANGGGGGGDVAIQDEGVIVQAAPTSINFVGTGVTATTAGTNVTVTIPGGGGGGAGAVPVQDEGIVVQSTPSSLNFVGAGVTASTSGTNVTITIPGGGGSMDAYATPLQAQAGTSTTTVVNPADLFARESLPEQTALANNLALIPAPTAGLSNWGVNLLGERLHYTVGGGWRVIANRFQQVTNFGTDGSSTGNTVIRGTWTAHRDGTVLASMFVVANSNGHTENVISAETSLVGASPSQRAATNNSSYTGGSMSATATTAYVVAAGSIISFKSYHEQTTTGITYMRGTIGYID